MATLSDGGGTTLTIDLNNVGETLGIVSNGTSYTFSTNNTFVDGGVTVDPGDFSAFGAASITLNDLTEYNTIQVNDLAAGTSVTFNNSGANAYSDDFSITLNNVAANPGLSFSGASSFGANNLTANIDSGVTFSSGSSVSTSGNVNLSSGGSITGPVTNGTAEITGAQIDLLISAGAGGIGTSAGQPLEINATTRLVAQTQTGDIFVTDTAGGLAVSGTGALVTPALVNLTATNGSLTSQLVDTTADIVGTTVTLAVTGSGDIGASAGSRLEVNADTLIATTGGAAGNDIFLRETGGVTGLSLNAGSGSIDLLSTGQIQDADGGDDVTAVNAILEATGGIGVTGARIGVSLTNLDITNNTSGAIFVTDSAGGLTLDDLAGSEAVSGVGGGGEIRASSPLTIAADAITAGGMTYTASDSALLTDHLTISGAGTDVQDTTASLTFNAGDNFVFNAGTTITAALGQVRIDVDPAAGDPDPLNGSIVNLSGTLAAVSLLINGGNNDDQLQINQSLGNPLPNLTTGSTVVGGHVNAAFTASGRGPGVAGAHFEAGGGADSLSMTYGSGGPVDVAYFSDTTQANSGVVNVLGSFTLSFDGLAPMVQTSLVGGTLTVDATSTPLTTTLTVNDTGGAADGANIVTGDNGFEATTFSGFDNLIVRGGDGSETITLVTVDRADPDAAPGGPAPLADITLDGDNTGGTDAAADTINVQALPAGVAGADLTLLGGDGNDIFNIDSNPGGAGGNVNGILDNIIVAGEAGGTDTLNLDDTGDGAANTFHMNATAIGGGAFGAAVSDGGIFGATGRLTYDATLEAIDVDAGNGANTFNIDATGVGGAAPASRVTIDDGTNTSTWDIQGNALSATADHTFNGNDGIDAFDIEIAAAAVVTGNTFVINGGNPGTFDDDNVDINDAGGARSVTYTYNATGVDVDGLDALAGANSFLDLNTVERVRHNGDAANNDAINVVGSAANDLLSVAPQSLTSALVFFNGDPFDGPPETFANDFPGVAGGATAPDLTLNGLLTVTGLELFGGGGGNDTLFVYGESEANLASGADVLIPGEGVGNAYDEILVTDALVRFVDSVQAAIPADVLIRVNINTVSFNDANALDDDLIVNSGFEAAPGAGGIADDIVATLSTSSTFGLQINGGDPVPAFAPNGDHLNVMTPAEINVFSDKATPPNVTVISGGNGQIGFSSIERVIFTPGNGVVNLIGDNNNPAVDQNDNFIVTGADVDGDLSDAGAGEFSLRINGDTVAPNSPALFFNGVQFLNVFGDDLALTPSAGPNHIDTLEITPYADNTPRRWGIDVAFNEGNPAGADGAQADLLIYHTSPAPLPPPAIPGFGDVSEDIVIQPSGPDNGELRVTRGDDGSLLTTVSYAANTDIVVIDDDGSATDTDTLTLRGMNPDTPNGTGDEFVSADFTALGDAANPMVRVLDLGPNGVLNTPVAPNAATVADDVILYRLRNFTGFNTINFELLGGDDTLHLNAGRVNGSLTVNYDGGAPDGSDTFIGLGVTNQDDAFIFTPGSDNRSGLVSVERDVDGVGTVPTIVNLSDTETVTFNGGGGTTQDTLTVNGTAGNDVFTLVGTAAVTGTIGLSGAPQITFTALGVNAGPTAVSDITLNGFGGDDQFDVTHFSGWQIDDVNLNGGEPNFSDTFQLVGSAVADTVSYLAATANSGQMDVTSGGSTTNYLLAGVEHAALDAAAGTDRLNMAVATGTQGVRVSRAGLLGDGLFEPFVTATSLGLLPLTARNAEVPVLTSASIVGGVVTIDGSPSVALAVFQGDDNSGVATVTVADLDGVGGVNDEVVQVGGQSVDITVVVSVTINALEGDDTVNVIPNPTGAVTPLNIPGPGAGLPGLIVVGGGNGAGSDLVTIADPNPTIDFATNLITNVSGGPFLLTGVETLTVNGSDGVADAFTVNNYGAATDVTTVNLNGADTAGGDDADTVDVSLTTGPDTLDYTPLGVTAATLLRREGGPRIQITNLNFDGTADVGDVTVAGNGELDTVHVIAPAGNDRIDVTRTGANNAVVTVVANGNPTGGTAWVPVDFDIITAGTSIDALSVDGELGNDLLNIDEGAGAQPSVLPLASGIYFDGGAGFDSLRLVYTGAGQIDASSYTVGPEAPQGRSTHTEGAASQNVFFTGLEPLIDLVAGPLSVSGTNADNAISYAIGPNTNTALVGGAAVVSGQVAIDAFEPIEFANKTGLTINGLGGSDSINLNHTSSPTGLTTITVDGGDPTGSDTLIVNDADSTTAINFTPSTASGATITGAQVDDVTATTIEHVTINGLGGNDTLNVNTPAATTSTIVLTPGATIDAGSVQVDSLVPMSFTNLGGTGRLTITDPTAADGDRLIYNGTAASDTFTVPHPVVTAPSIALNAQIGVGTTAVENYTLRGLAGDDVFNLTPQATSITVQGGEPGSSDVLVVNGTAAADTFTLTPAATPGDGNVVVGGVNNLYTGIEHVVLNANSAVGALDNLTVNDDGRDNLWTVSAGPTDPPAPIGTGAGTSDRVQIAGRESIDYRNFNNVTLTNGNGTDTFEVHPTNLVEFGGTFTVNGDAALPLDDVLHFVGTEAADVVTATATAVTTNGVTITVGGTNYAELRISTLGGNDVIGHDGTGLNPPPLALNLAGVRKVIDAGAGNDIVNGSAMADADIYGMDGDDNLIGTPLADNIFGGRGNDTISGLAGDDAIYGEEGNDSITGGTGNDQLFGGGGADRFTWNNGDNSDVIDGGDGDDVSVVNDAVAANADTFVVRPDSTDPSRLFFERTNLIAFNITMSVIEELDINSGGSADSITIRDVTRTTVRTIDIDVGAADAAADNVFVNGRSVADDLLTTSPAAGQTITAGLTYDVRISNSTIADRLTINGNEGDDQIKVDTGVEAQIAITLNGDDGNDYLSADAIINGGPGNDFLEGGSGADTISGNDGDDTMIGLDGADSFDGGAGFDTILVPGTGSGYDPILVPANSSNDLINVFQASTTTLTHTVNGNTQTDTLVAGTVENVKIDAGQGADLIRVGHDDSLFGSVGTALRMTIDGGLDGTSDRLIFRELGTDDLTVYRKSEVDSAGTVTIAPGANPATQQPFQYVFEKIERVDFVDENGAPLNAEPGNAARLVVFKHDPNEFNDDRFTATHIGANFVFNYDPNIDPGPIVNPFGDNQDVPGDRDFYRIEAAVTGTLDIQVFFEEIAAIGARPGLPGNGNLDMEVFDRDGTLIAGNAAQNVNGNNFGLNDGGAELNLDGDTFNEDERIRIPVVQGQVYYVRVFGVGTAINNYTMTVINDPAPVPFDMELDDIPVGFDPFTGTAQNSDTGRSQFDNVTRDNTPTVVFRLDDGTLLNDVPGNNTASTPQDQVTLINFQGVNANPGYRIAVFDEGADTTVTPGNAGNTNVRTPLGFATQVEGGLYQFTTPVLNDGSHFLTARVQMLDPANPQITGFGERSLSLEIIVDTVDPLVSFGTAANAVDGLHPDSDSGVQGGLTNQATLDDRITNDETPTFWGRAEADSFIRIFLDVNNNQTVDIGTDILIGQTTTVPLDGSNQFPGNTGTFPGGEWQITSTINMNDNEVLTALGQTGVIDGIRRFLVTAEDVAGNFNDAAALPAAQQLNLFVDTQGPNVFDPDGAANARHAIEIVGRPEYDLFDSKHIGPGTTGPTPLINALDINIRDLPNRVTEFLYASLQENTAGNPAENTGHFRVIGDANGLIPIQSISFTSDGDLLTAGVQPLTAGNPATGVIRLTFAEPLPDDRFTITISDELVDPAGNNLDGENNAVEPHEPPLFPTGDGQPGGSFSARFTVDSRPELGVWAAGTSWVDTNGNFSFDPRNLDFTNRDITYSLGNGNTPVTSRTLTSDDQFAGNFPNIKLTTPVADGFDKLASYGSTGPVDGPYRWIIDVDNDGRPDVIADNTQNVNGKPVAGDFSAAFPGDELAVFTGTQWFFYRIVNATTVAPLNIFGGGNVVNSPIRGYPIAGDFDGDNLEDLGTYADDQFRFDLANNGFGQQDQVIEFGFIGVREQPIAHDFDQDGIDDIGLWVPDRSGVTPSEGAEWYILVSNDFDAAGAVNFPDDQDRAPGSVNTLNHPFEPIPFAKDIYATFGDEYALPIVGNFDPPVPSAAAGATLPSEGYTNPANPLDVNADGKVTAIDALIGVNLLNSEGAGTLFGNSPTGPYFDTNADKKITGLDVLLVLNYLNDRAATTQSQAQGEPGGDAISSNSPPVAPAETAPSSTAARTVDTALTSLQIFPASPMWPAQPVPVATADSLDAILDALARDTDRDPAIDDEIFAAL